MDLGEKLELLTASARYDASCASSGSMRSPGRGGIGAGAPAGVCHSFTGDGRCISLLKVLYSNQCRFDCAYCANRSSADTRRASFTVEELVRLTIGFYRRNYIEGLFLSSGLFADADIVMGKLIEVARVLRRQEGFGGYIHLKAIPGCGERLLRKAGLYADRLSANIELPSSRSLACLAPQKAAFEIIGAMRIMRDAELEAKEDGHRLSSSPRFAPAGQSTQLIVGASGEDDRTIVSLASALYGSMRLRRVYYSAYIPVSTDPRLPAARTPPLLREHRLYQADWLMRCYGFKAEEILDDSSSVLAMDLDPKASWALRHPEFFPVDAATADLDTLLRVPGIGATGARRIIETRRCASLSPESVARMGIVMKRARWFLSLRSRPLERQPEPGRLRLLLADRSAGGFARGAQGGTPGELPSGTQTRAEGRDLAPARLGATGPVSLPRQLELGYDL